MCPPELGGVSLDVPGPGQDTPQKAVSNLEGEEADLLLLEAGEKAHRSSSLGTT